jgi:hypothetical protein
MGLVVWLACSVFRLVELRSYMRENAELRRQLTALTERNQKLNEDPATRGTAEAMAVAAQLRSARQSLIGLMEQHIERTRYLPWVGLVGFAIWITRHIPKSVVSFYRSSRARRGLCVHCGYNLTGNVSGVCPECGTARAAS